MSAEAVSQPERDRAARLGRLAAGAGRGIGGACPYRTNRGPKQRVLAAVFVRAYFAAGGTLDGLDYGDGQPAPTTTTRATTTRTRTTPPAGAGQRHKPAGRAYGELY